MLDKTVDPVALTQRLVQCRSVTPCEGGAIVALQELLTTAGFRCERVDRNGIANLYARWGNAAPVFGFNGHTDTVPVGNVQDWSVDPFSGEIKDGKLWGRGAADMKSGVAAFVAAAVDFVQTGPRKGSVAIMITGDEEGAAQDGSAAIVDWMQHNNQHLSVCLVGEPTCPDQLGDAIKVGRRGSLSVQIVMHGIQGHSAYPDRYINPIEAMIDLGHVLNSTRLDEGTKHFQPTNLAITSFETGNTATNVVPAACTATVNIRFCDLHTTESLLQWMDAEARQVAETHGCGVEIARMTGAESFYTSNRDFAKLVSNSIAKVLGQTPELSTSGGTSDARFLAPLCPVVEFGLVGKTIHQVDEHVAVEDINALKQVYRQCLDDYLG